MALWIQRGMRLDIELAVALEFGSVRITRAQSAAERELALTYNRMLWDTIRRLVATAPEVEYRDALRDSADKVASGSPETMMLHNAEHARALAAKAATGGALSRLLDDWRVYRGRQPDAEFGNWLLSRMEPEPMPIAA